jgi:hypothetical protein
MGAYKYVVLTNPVPGREADYNDWYDARHLDDVLRVPGFVAAQRLEIADQPTDTPPKHKYLTIYDIESDDIAKTFEVFFARVGTHEMPISDALARDANPILYRAMGPVRRRTGESEA